MTTNLTHEKAVKLSKTYGNLNFLFRAIVPCAIAIAVWGAVKEPSALTPEWVPESMTALYVQVMEVFKTLSFGVVASALVFGMEAKDTIKKTMEEYKVQKRTVFSKNHFVLYLGAGVFLGLCYLVATKAMVFCFGSALSSGIAFICEKKRNDYIALSLEIK